MNLEMAVHKIYLIYDPSGKKAGYVGWTVRPIEKRFYRHVYDAKHGSKLHVHLWLKKMNYDVSLILLEIVPDGKSYKDAEKKWIKNYLDLGWDLKNKTDGGDGVLGLKKQKESNDKTSASLKKWYANHVGQHPRGMLGKVGPNNGKILSKEERKKDSQSLIAWHAANPDARKGKNNGMFRKPSPMRGKHYSKESNAASLQLRKIRRLVKENRPMTYDDCDLFQYVVGL